MSRKSLPAVWIWVALFLAAASARAGLLGEYYTYSPAGVPGNPFTGGNYRGSRYDTTVNYNWGTGGPGIAGIGDNYFAIRWRGQVYLPSAGNWTFYTSSDDGVRLWVDGVIRIDNWALMGGQELNTGAIALSAGWHTLQLEYFENEGNSLITLSWEGPGVPKSIIPDAATAYPWGLTGAYYSAGGTAPTISEPSRRHSRIDSTVGFNWGTGDPAAAGIGADSFATVWRGRVYLPSAGNWTFYTNTDDGARLWIDGVQRINQWVDQGPTQVSSGALNLSAGWHVVEMHYYENGGGAVAELRYEGPGVSQQVIPSSVLAADRGLIGFYYDGNLPSATYRFERIDPEVNFNWDTSSPAAVTPADYFSARWRGKIEVPTSGDYTFYVTSDDGVELWVNGQRLINILSRPQSPTETSGTVTLTAGRRYFIDLMYNEFTGGAVCQLSWSGPGITKQIIPMNRLLPILNEAPTDIALSGTTIGSGAAVNTPVGALSTDDPDNTSGASPAQTFTYAIVSGGGGNFAISGDQLVKAAAEVTPGTYTLTIRSTDNGTRPAGLYVGKTFNITVTDTTPPANPTVSSTSHAVNGKTQNNVMTMTWSGATDNFSGVAGYSWAFSNSPSTVPDTVMDTPQGTDPHTVSSGTLAEGTWYFHLRTVDNNGNWSSKVTWGPTIIDRTPPVITLNGNATVTLECPASYTDAGATATDNVDGNLTASIVVTNPVDGAVAGTYVVRYNVSDAAGNAATEVTRTVTITDSTPPVVDIFGGTFMYAECNVPLTLPNGYANDSCAGALPVTISSYGGLNITAPQKGTYYVTYRAFDGVQPGFRTLEVQVRDTQLPVLLVNTTPVTGECGVPVTLPTASANDLCGPVTRSVVYNGLNPAKPQAGVYTVTYRAEDGSGNVATQNVQVTIQDTAAPVVTLNGPASVTLECGDVFTDPGALAVDACEGALPVAVSGSVNPAVAGTYTLTYAAQDSGNRTGQATRVVTVEDTTAPVVTIDGPNPVYVLQNTVFTTPSATAVDACEGSLPVTVSGSVNTEVAGTYTLTYSARDSGNRTGTAALTVVVTPDLPPVITLAGDNPLTLSCGDAYVEPGATATDDVDGDVTGSIVISGQPPAGPLAPGSWTVTYSVSDSYGNTATATRTVVIQDNCPLTVTATGTTLTVPVGGRAEFAVTVTGAIGSVTYQWFRDDGSKAWVPLSGENGDTLVIDPVSESDAGQYQCEVSDSVTSVTSPVFTLVIGSGVPVAGPAGLMLAGLGLALLGARSFRRRS